MSTVRRIRPRATPSRHSLALLALLAALPPVVRAVDVCDEEGICTDVEATLVRSIPISGVQSAYWPSYTNR